VRSNSGPAELLLDLGAALAAIDARWYVFGAQAALVWGRPRLTSDVDVTVQFSGGDTQDLIDALRASFTLRIEGSPEFVRVTAGARRPAQCV
jgi:hypothetical protein